MKPQPAERIESVRGGPAFAGEQRADVCRDGERADFIRRIGSEVQDLLDETVQVGFNRSVPVRVEFAAQILEPEIANEISIEAILLSNRGQKSAGKLEV